MESTLKLMNYSEKALVIYGQTKEYKDNLKQLGGRFNPYLTIEGKRTAAWIFSKRRETELINFINTLGSQKFGEVCNTCNFELPTKVNETAIVTPPVIERPIEQPIIQEQTEQVTEQVIETKQTETPKESKVTKVVKAIKSVFKVNYKSIFSQFKTNNSLPILDCIKIEANGTAVLSDLETNVILPNYFSNKSEGAICLPLEQIKKIDKANELRLDINGISASLGVFKLTGMNAEEFPLPCKQDIVFKHIGTLNKNGIEAVNVAYNYVGKDELRPVMTGVYFDSTNGKIASTDAHKLFSKNAHELTESFIINKKTAKLLSLLSDAYEVYLSDNNVKFESVNGTIISRLIDGNYVNYEAVTPKNNDKIFELDKAKLVKVINEAIKCANKTTKQIIFSFKNNIVTVSSQDLDFGLEYSCEIEAKCNIDFQIGFNGKFLLDILANIQDNRIELKCSENNRAALINTDFLLMPVMINE
jgi:DNA polymerase-3 subunit beta